jgi:signal transduction histidine kinase/DNA-binding response OmpR family regulator/ligand-binding sensor domain-containing protein
VLSVEMLYSRSFRYLNVEKGLSSNQVFQVKKDSTGFIWFVSYMGIDRYDGSEIKHYLLGEDDAKYKNYMPFTQMEIDRQGNIWIGLDAAKLFRYSKKCDAFEQMLDVRALTGKDLLLYSFYLDSRDRVWISTSGGLYLSDEKQNLELFPLMSKQYPTQVVQTGNKFYIATPEYIYEIEETNSRFQIKNQVEPAQNYGRVESLLYYNGKLYIGTESKGVYIYDTQTKQVKSLYPLIPNVAIRAMACTQEKTILIGTDGAGIYGLHPDTGHLLFSWDADNMDNELSSNSIYDILVDETNCIWATTYTSGVNVIYPLLPNINFIRHDNTNFNSLINNQVNAILEDSDGDLWYGTGNGISLYLKKKNEWKYFLTNREQKAVIITLCEDKQKRIWAGAYSLGLFCIDKNTGKVMLYQKDEKNPGQGISANYVFGLHADEHSLWIAGLNGDLTRYNLKEGTWQYYPIQGIVAIAPLNDHYLLLGNSNGFYVFDKNTGKYKDYTQYNDRFTNCSVTDFYVSGTNDVWIATEGNGLVNFNPYTETFLFYTTEEGLPSNYIYSIEGDDFGRIWIATDRNISYFDIQTRTILNIGDYIGLNNLTYNMRASAKQKNNNLLFGTSDGAVEFSADYVPNIQIDDKIVFTDFKLFYNSVEINAENSPLHQSIDETKSITLGHNQNSFTFVFSSINFMYPNQVVYNYQLEGFDTEWFVPDGNDKTINYTNINPGKYVFKLRVFNKNTKELLDEREIAIRINPPFWQSTWAWIIYLILAITLLLFILNYLNNRMDKKNARDKVQFFIGMAHDIRTPLSLIKAPLSDLSEKENLSQSGKEILDIAIRNTERLFLMTSQLLDFEKSDMSSLCLIASKNNLEKYIKEQVLLYSSSVKSKGLTLTYEMNLHSIYVWFDKEKMNKIVDNLLTNAIKYTNEGGKIHLKVTQDENNWYLKISDTGIGIPQTEQKYLFKRFFRAKNAINSKESGSGIGLLLTMQLVKLHQGTISFSSKEGQGTEFNLTFQMGKEYFEQKGHHMEDPEEEEEISENTGFLSNEEEEEESTKKARVLIVEDNNDMRTYLMSVLSADYQVAEAGDGEEAMGIIPEFHPDLVLADIMMPRLNGDEMCSKLKNSIHTSHIPIILLTALNDKGSIIKGLDCGADDYIPKPFDITIVRARIRNILLNRQKVKDRFLQPDAHSEAIEYDNPLDKDFMAKAIAIVEENLDKEDFSIRDFEMIIGMSRSSLYNKLKALTGQGPSDFVRIIRLNKAKELLMSKRYNVFEVSIMTGFSDSKYFSTAFKKQFGVSPSKIGK